MKYGIKEYFPSLDLSDRGGASGWVRTVHAFDTREERDQLLVTLRLQGYEMRPIRILSHEEAKRKARAETWRAAADRLQDAVDGLRADGYDVEAEWIAKHVKAYRKTAAELWPEGE